MKNNIAREGGGSVTADDFKCPNCGASLEDEGFDDVNEFGDVVLRCANCGYGVPYD